MSAHEDIPTIHYGPIHEARDILDDPVYQLRSQQHAATYAGIQPPPTVCDCCGHRAFMTHILNVKPVKTRETRWPYVYVCTNCSARVGVHPNTFNPYGTMAEAWLRSLRSEAKDMFETMVLRYIAECRDGDVDHSTYRFAKQLSHDKMERRIRQEAYEGLAFFLNIKPEQTQFALFTKKRVRDVSDVLNNYHLITRKALPHKRLSFAAKVKFLLKRGVWL